MRSAEQESAPHPAAEKDLTVKLPAAGDYLIWLEAKNGVRASIPGAGARHGGSRVGAPLPAAPTGFKEWQVLALDEKTGYVGSKTLPAKEIPSSVSFTTPDFDRVHRVLSR